jgi:hypothetical protein
MYLAGFQGPAADEWRKELLQLHIHTVLTSRSGMKGSVGDAD